MSGPFREVLESLAGLQSLLDAELERGRAQTANLTALDADATLAYAKSRTEFTTRLATLETELAARVAGAAAALGLRGFEIQDVRRLHPEPGRHLAVALEGVGRTAAAVRRQDALNQMLASRARACVSGWLRALTGSPAAYDRQGAARGIAALTTAVRVV